MGKIVRGIVIFLLVLIVGFCFGGLFLPDEFTMQRSTLIDAPTDRIFTLVNDLEQMLTWSPWKAKDPGMEIIWGASRQGVGATYSWKSPEMGGGSLTIVESVPISTVTMDLNFMENGKAKAIFVISPEANRTRVTWSMLGNANGSIMGRYFGMLMDHMAGADFEDGLRRLKDKAEDKS